MTGPWPPPQESSTMSDRTHDLCEWLLAEARWWAERGRDNEARQLAGPGWPTRWSDLFALPWEVSS